VNDLSRNGTQSIQNKEGNIKSNDSVSAKIDGEGVSKDGGNGVGGAVVKNRQGSDSNGFDANMEKAGMDSKIQKEEKNKNNQKVKQDPVKADVDNKNKDAGEKQVGGTSEKGKKEDGMKLEGSQEKPKNDVAGGSANKAAVAQKAQVAEKAKGEESDQLKKETVAKSKPKVKEQTALTSNATDSKTPAEEPVQSTAANSNASQTKSDPPKPKQNSTLSLLVSLVFTVFFGIIGGRISERFKQSNLLGMLLAGVIARNALPFLILPLPHSWTTPLWTIALSAVTSRAGLSLQASTVSQHLVPTLMIGAIPVIVEALFLSTLSRSLFPKQNLDTPWSFTLAFGVASVSPGVVIPLLLNLYERPHWKTSRLPPILLGATGLDVLISTTGFGVSLASVFGHHHESLVPGHDHGDHPVGAGVAAAATKLAMEEQEHAGWLTRGLEEVMGGIVGGIMVGALAFAIRKVKVVESVATMVVFTISTVGMMVTKLNGFPGTASSSVIIAWAIIANVWEKETIEASTKR
jgi:uncharacterized membrane protein YeaQ/YmgE (transglycosylase-associated protein family)